MTTSQIERVGRDDALRQAVLLKVRSLQRQELENVPSAGARLARLRRALATSPGSVADVWADTTGALPPGLLGRGDEPSPYEQAVHAVMCLYALHQQSQSDPMHVDGQDLGTAVQILRRRRGADDDIDPVLRRFHALATANSLAETLHHLRGLVTLLRGAHVGLDYGQLAVDLRRLQNPNYAGRVRRDWGRSLYGGSSSRPQTSTTAAPSSTSDADGGDA